MIQSASLFRFNNPALKLRPKSTHPSFPTVRWGRLTLGSTQQRGVALKSIDEKKRQEVLRRARQAMSDVKASMESKEYQETYLEFMSKYAAIESGYKILLLNYLLDKGQRRPIEDLRIEPRQVRAVLNYYRIILNDSDRDNIFNGRQAKGSRKARGLRNSLAHRPNTEALSELSSKKAQLFASMNALVDAINTEAKEC